MDWNDDEGFGDVDWDAQEALAIARHRSHVAEYPGKSSKLPQGTSLEQRFSKHLPVAFPPSSSSYNSHSFSAAGGRENHFQNQATSGRNGTSLIAGTTGRPAGDPRGEASSHQAKPFRGATETGRNEKGSVPNSVLPSARDIFFGGAASNATKPMKGSASQVDGDEAGKPALAASHPGGIGQNMAPEAGVGQRMPLFSVKGNDGADDSRDLGRYPNHSTALQHCNHNDHHHGHLKGMADQIQYVPWVEQQKRALFCGGTTSIMNENSNNVDGASTGYPPTCDAGEGNSNVARPGATLPQRLSSASMPSDVVRDKSALPSHIVSDPVPDPLPQRALASSAPPPTIHATISLSKASGAASANGKSGCSMASSASNPKEKDLASSTGGKDTQAVESMIEISMGWHESAAAALRKVPCGTWNPRRRVWVFPLSMHDAVMDALRRAQGIRVKVEPLHTVPVSVLRASGAIPDDSSRYCHIPSFLESQLMPFQRDGVRFGLRHGGRCLIGDEMGLGKTVQALALVAAYRDEWPCLIIAPSSLREQWADSLHRWLNVTEDRIHVVHTGKDAARVAQKGAIDFLVVSYNFLDKMDISGGKYKVIIVDESHFIKDGSAKRTKAAMPILKECRRCILLTGTPALNRPKEIFTQLASLLPAAKLRMSAFGERYCAGNRFDKYGGAMNLEELHAMLRGSIMVRRLKSDVLSELPQKRRQQIFLSLDSEKRRELSALSKQFEAVKAVLAQMTSMNVASGGAVSLNGARSDENKAIMEMYRRTAELKQKAVQEYVELLLDGGQKFLIFAHHTCLMDAIEHTCNRRKGCKHIRIDGKTPASDRSRLVSQFQDDDSVRVAILSIRAAGVGLTLTAASTVVFAEMTWTPGEIIQAEDRAHRIGQASSVNVYFLHVKGSVDDIIWASVQNKLENVGQAIDGQDRGMEVKKVRNMPEKGQMSLESFLTPTGNGAGTGSSTEVVEHQRTMGGNEGTGALEDRNGRAAARLSPPKIRLRDGEGSDAGRMEYYVAGCKRYKPE